MTTDDFNKNLGELTGNFVKNWIRLVDEYASDNELGVNHKLTCLLYSHLGIERALSDRVWMMGSDYMGAVIKAEKEILKNDN